MTKKVNKVKVSGRLVAVSDARIEGFDKTFTVHIKDEKKSADKSRSDNNGIFPKFFCSKEVIGRFENREYAHKRITVEGYVESYDTKGLKQQRFVATSIIEEPTLTEKVFGVKGMFFGEPQARVYIAGRVDNIANEPKNGWVFIDLETEHGIIRVNARDPHRAEISVNDNLCICGKIYTVNKETKNGRNHHFESITVDDFGVVPVA